MGVWDDRAEYNKDRDIREQIYGEVFEYAKTQPCCAQHVPSHECITPITGAHLLTTKNRHPDWNNCVPACIVLHRQMHDKGPKWVNRHLGLNLEEVARKLTRKLMALAA